MGHRPNRLVAVIPAYNEELTIARVVRDLTPLVDQIFVIDDGSEDATARVARTAGAHVIRHRRNVGIGRALQTGYRAAAHDKADILVQLDADGQHNSRYLNVLLEALDDSTDVVIGSRFIEGDSRQYSRIRRWGIRFFSFLTSVFSGTKVLDVTSGYRIYWMRSLLKIPPIRSRHWAVEQTLAALRLNLNVKEVGIPIPPRTRGTSQFRPDVAMQYPFRVSLGIFRALRSRPSNEGLQEAYEEDILERPRIRDRI